TKTYTLSLHDALPILERKPGDMAKIRTLSERDHEDYFERIYSEYFDRLFAYALVITKSENLAKDVVSDVFFNLWNAKKNLSSVRSEEHTSELQSRENL